MTMQTKLTAVYIAVSTVAQCLGVLIACAVQGAVARLTRRGTA